MRTIGCALFVLLLTCGASAAPSTTVDARVGVEAFNRAFDHATRDMDNAATLALWEDDGVSLLPSTAPIVGKRAIAKFMDDVLRQLPGARMKSFEDRCFDIQISGDLASEWCQEHQVVTFANGKPPFDGRGKMLLVLHRGGDGQWRLQQEMWNQAAVEPAPK
ncbi:MAG: nuclear transport factor 2 family protein [Rhodanobacteraceae bacterium]